ncbi:PAS domain S-box protein [Amylibacter sp. SFDW26]|uniref:cache domain-containing protein n=1 Tax=Amylibacter sp. SFDW26 TaxID=2652722 RepID=UPI00126209D9|nr:cache domain-containing protein [Amylibacter sp. SFDW26]KAB7613780.1 PAS domain S-box protein [Amylibacter sp. SFDW26]
MKLSLGAILAICLAGLQLIAVLSVVLSSYVTSERVLLDHARSLLSDLGLNAIEHSKGFLQPARGTAELAKRLAENEIVASDNPEILEKLLFQNLQISPQFSGLYYGDQTGSFVYVMRSSSIGPYRTKIITNSKGDRVTKFIWRNEDYSVVGTRFDATDTFDPRERPWYKNVLRTRDIIWTDPYIFFSSKKPGITAASPVIKSNGQLDGVIGVDIEIDAISDFLSNLKIGNNGAVIILNRNGDVIAHPNPDLIKIEDADGTLKFANINEILDPIAQAAFGTLPKTDDVTVQTEISSKFKHGGKTYVSTLMPMGQSELPWTIAVYVPEDDFTGGIKDNRTRNIWIAFAIAVITGLLGLKLADRIIKPVRDFAVRAELASKGEVDVSKDLPKTYPELEDANDTLVHEIVQRKISEREYGQTFDLASRGMAEISPNTGRFIRVNSQLADILGYSADEILGMRFSDILHPDDSDTYAFFQDAVHEDYEYNQEKRYLHKDGSTIWLRVNAILIRDEHGKPLHAVATVDDVTAQKVSEVKINGLSRDLSHFARVNMMGEMAAGLAHELNQPLTAITQNADAALSTLQEQTTSDPELTQILTELDQQAHRGADIIRALRGFVRKDEGSKAAFDFSELVEQALHLVQSEASVHGISIVFNAENIPNVFGNRIQIAQVLVNLIRNSIEAIASGNTALKQIDVIAKEIDNFVEVWVEDTGAGVNPDINLFTQFETSKSDGMGLGLSFSRSIVEANGGQLWYDVNSAEKSRFCFTLASAVVNEEVLSNV